ncbi:hypothetical protein HWD35_21425 [Tsukamurella tyrosinosolvens]|uniref:DUF6602 domain-containing protein n=1 Tax=Tsukamurella tyrosinosolvens TaxID=57704 RepID=UPI001CE0A585|nr:DUF6602 domain-containing protein [Tsukamurella tyrosinosolvens]MCA4997288.1 hypothetical protein [Tsukamurella tyrosinosolvens]
MTSQDPTIVERAFVSTTKTMLEKFHAAREMTDHPVLLGDGLEDDWRSVLENFLPRRFAVSKAVIVDSLGGKSEQIDLVVHDRHFSPEFWTIGGVRHLPAECVYAVFEAKPHLNKAYIEYAADKAHSVRRLHRTSAPIQQLAQSARPVEPKRIIAGIVSARSEWTPPLGVPLVGVLRSLDESHRIDMGCALAGGMFERPEDGTVDDLVRSSADSGLALFAMRLTARLNAIGTVPALDYGAYTSGITEEVPRAD